MRMMLVLMFCVIAGALSDASCDMGTCTDVSSEVARSDSMLQVKTHSGISTISAMEQAPNCKLFLGVGMENPLGTVTCSMDGQGEKDLGEQCVRMKHEVPGLGTVISQRCDGTYAHGGSTVALCSSVGAVPDTCCTTTNGQQIICGGDTGFPTDGPTEAEFDDCSAKCGGGTTKPTTTTEGNDDNNSGNDEPEYPEYKKLTKGKCNSDHFTSVSYNDMGLDCKDPTCLIGSCALQCQAHVECAYFSTKETADTGGFSKPYCYLHKLEVGCPEKTCTSISCLMDSARWGGYELIRQDGVTTTTKVTTTEAAKPEYPKYDFKHKGICESDRITSFLGLGLDGDCQDESCWADNCALKCQDVEECVYFASKGPGTGPNTAHCYLYKGVNGCPEKTPVTQDDILEMLRWKSYEMSGRGTTTTTTYNHKCQPWCRTDSKSWTEKCGWKSCKQCCECDQQDPIKKCESWCACDPAPWEQKCSWSNCKKCNKCKAQIVDDCPSYCLENLSDRCGWKVCKKCADCEKKPACGDFCALEENGGFKTTCKWKNCKGCAECLKDRRNIAHTTLTVEAKPGDQKLETEDNFGFAVGDKAILDQGTDKQEAIVVSGMGSIILETPLKYAHYPPATIDIDPSMVTGDTAGLDQDGYASVAGLRCTRRMMDFVMRVVAQEGFDVCDMGGVAGFSLWFDQPEDGKTYAALVSELKTGATGDCPFLVASGGECQPFAPTCPSYPGVELPECA